MRRRRKIEEESSLELLLDTMCNTFGGVMFIAISLLVISMNLVQQQPLETTNSNDRSALQSQIDALRIMLEELQMITQLKKVAVQLQKNDDKSRKQHELLMARQLVKELKIKNSAIDSAVKQLQIPLQQAQELQRKLDNELNLQKITNHRQEAELLTLQSQQETLARHRLNQLELSFKLIKSSSEEPFFIILHGTKVWPVGPWRMPDGKDQEDEAVSSSEYINGNILAVSCQRKAGYGIEVLENDRLSGAFTDLLQKLPARRIPKFFVHPNSAPTAFKMREILKKKNIRHGCSLAPGDDEDFKYQYTNNVDYEY